MRKSLLAIICLLSHLLAFPQEDPIERSDPIRIGLSFSIDIVDRSVSISPGTSPYESRLYERDGYNSSRIAYTAGIDLLIPLSLRYSLQTGLRYADRGFESRSYAGYIAQDPVENDPAISTNVTHGYHFQYLDLPLLLRGQFGDRRLKPTIVAGVQSSYLLGVYRVIFNEIPEGPKETERAEDIFAFNEFNLFPTLGLGLIHQSTDRIWVRSEIAGSYGVVPITNAPARGMLWNVGIVLGVFYSFSAS